MADEKDSACSIVDYMRDHSGYRCGYCKSKDTNFSHGMWSHRLSVSDYQNLIDRGWRRSGHYCYKPTMEKLCCPMYTIRCDAVELKLSKTQKKVLKRMHRYLSHGLGKDEKPTPDNECSGSGGGSQEYVKPVREAQDLSKVVITQESLAKAKGNQNESTNSTVEQIEMKKENKTVDGAGSEPSCSSENNKMDAKNVKGSFKTGCTGADPSRPPCRKAKDIRRERREAKLKVKAQEASHRGETLMDTNKNTKNIEKTLEDFLNEPLPENPAHTLEVRLVRSQPASPEFLNTAKDAHKTYQKYQMNIHGDTKDKCNEQQYKRFLCNSPLELKLVRVKGDDEEFQRSYNSSYGVFRKYQLEIHNDTEDECDKSSFKGFLVDGPLVSWKPASGPDEGYGSFHHQYWLDGRLIAVGVVDILPHCISSVYLYYDPQYSFLSLGTYASLRELALTRELQRKSPALRWYYMGFYIHSCAKMRYKGRYRPSLLLCPETYIWVDIDKAVQKLDISKYARFNDDPTATDANGQVNYNQIPVLHQNTFLPYSAYRQLYPNDEEDHQEVKEYASYVGTKTAYNMLLYRS